MLINRLIYCRYIILLLFLSSCAGFEGAHIGKDYGSGGEIRNHATMGDDGMSSINSIAQQRCSARGYDGFKITGVDEPEFLRTEYYTYFYKCTKNVKSIVKPQPNNNSIKVDLNKAKNQCKSLGFKSGTEKFADCVMQLAN